jgi:hypothetical protein
VENVYFKIWRFESAAFKRRGADRDARTW